MPFTKLSDDFFDDPSTVKLERMLDDVNAGIYPLRLWTHAAKHAYKTGELKPYSAEALEHLMRWEGEKGKGESALLEAGFLEKSETGYRICAWPVIGGHIANYKERAKKGGRALWNKISSK